MQKPQFVNDSRVIFERKYARQVAIGILFYLHKSNMEMKINGFLLHHLTVSCGYFLGKYDSVLYMR